MTKKRTVDISRKGAAKITMNRHAKSKQFMQQRIIHATEIRIRCRAVHDHIGHQMIFPLAGSYMNPQAMAIP
ncbi:hypothetical protein AA0243_0376 [Novacetimonas hansenii NRIC 0243]|nr:hypothetical protein AA0243_0376 [Novacetimonas hansenii NRIC 0243]